MNEPRRHHTVPQLLLRRFAAKNKLVVRDLITGKKFTSMVANALVSADFYTFTMADGTQSREIEKMLSGVEGAAATALAQLLDEGNFPPSEAQREALSLFFAFQALRNPNEREKVRSFYEQSVRHMVKTASPEAFRKHLRKDLGREPTKEEVDDLLQAQKDSDGYGFKVENEPALYLPFLLKAPETVPCFFNRSWELYHFADPVLITSDVPLVLTSDLWLTFGSVGLATAAEILVPLSPKHALVMRYPANGRQDQRREGSAAKAEQFNTLIAHQCYRFLVHAAGHDPLEGLPLPTRPRPSGTR